MDLSNWIWTSVNRFGFVTGSEIHSKIYIVVDLVFVTDTVVVGTDESVVYTQRLVSIKTSAITGRFMCKLHWYASAPGVTG